jgi:hypothetical protein
MRIAICLFGQPRNYQKGYEVLTQFLTQQKNVTADFFYHTWTLEPGRIYPTFSPRHISISNLTYNQNTISELNKLYKPIAHSYETQKIDFTPQRFETTLAYKNTVSPKKKENMNNVLSQMYSRSAVRNLLNQHILSTNTFYNTVIMTRFDYGGALNFKLNNLDLSYTYVAGKNYPQRCILPDTFIMAPQAIFLDWFAMFENMDRVLNTTDVYTSAKKYGETIEINGEEIILAHYLFYNAVLERVKYSPFIQIGL